MNILHTAHCTLHTVISILQCTLKTTYCTLQTGHWFPNSITCTKRCQYQFKCPLSMVTSPHLAPAIFSVPILQLGQLEISGGRGQGSCKKVGGQPESCQTIVEKRKPIFKLTFISPPIFPTLIQCGPRPDGDYGNPWDPGVPGQGRRKFLDFYKNKPALHAAHTHFPMQFHQQAKSTNSANSP